MRRYPWFAAALFAALIAPQGCSLAYVRDYEHGGNQVTEFGLLGIPDPGKEGPGGLLPLYRRVSPVEPRRDVRVPPPLESGPPTPLHPGAATPLVPPSSGPQASPSYAVEPATPAGITDGFVRYETALGVHLTSDWRRLGEGASLGNIPSGAHVAFRNLKLSCPTHFYILSFAPSEPYLACLFPNLGTDEQGNTATNPLRPNQPYSFPGRDVSYPVGPLPQGVKSQEETVYLVTSAASRPDLLEACEKFADAIQNRRSAEAHQILKTFGQEMAHPEPGTRVTAIRFLHVDNGSRAIPHPTGKENGNAQR
jgi:hypothetical protein